MHHLRSHLMRDKNGKAKKCNFQTSNHIKKFMIIGYTQNSKQSTTLELPISWKRTITPPMITLKSIRISSKSFKAFLPKLSKILMIKRLIFIHYWVFWLRFQVCQDLFIWPFLTYFAFNAKQLRQHLRTLQLLQPVGNAFM